MSRSRASSASRSRASSGGQPLVELDGHDALAVHVDGRRRGQPDDRRGHDGRVEQPGASLVGHPSILILDEPTLGLAPVILEQISRALEVLRQTTPITVLLGEQNVTFALPHADRVYVLEHARIIWQGPASRFAEEAGAGYL
jgi:ABC-type thiamine transport system ATPase subunit